MSLVEPNCFKRKCKYYIGVIGYPEEYQNNICEAYPEGIPGDIAYGKDKHLKVRADQGNIIIYEKKVE